jgi:hypothetical protein
MSDSVESAAHLYEADLRAFFGIADAHVPAFDAVFLGSPFDHSLSSIQHQIRRC